MVAYAALNMNTDKYSIGHYLHMCGLRRPCIRTHRPCRNMNLLSLYKQTVGKCLETHIHQYLKHKANKSIRVEERKKKSKIGDWNKKWNLGGLYSPLSTGFTSIPHTINTSSLSNQNTSCFQTIRFQRRAKKGLLMCWYPNKTDCIPQWISASLLVCT